MILTLKNIYSEVLCKLKKNNIEMPELETQIILEHVTNLKLEKIYTKLNKKIYSKKINLIRKLTKRIITGEPIQYVTEHAFFYSLKFFVSKDVLIPRPESETIVDLALKILESNKYKEVLDLCCGSGCLGIAIYKNCKKKIKVDFSDISKKSMNICLKNIEKHIKTKNYTTYVRDLYGKSSKKYDLIISNPPYVSQSEYLKLDKKILNFEPKAALVSKENGFFLTKKIIKKSVQYLNKNGTLIIEVGKNQANYVKKIFSSLGFDDIVVSKDLNKINRVIAGKWTK